MTELLIYGVDGMSNKVVQMMMADDALPNLQELQNRDGVVYGSWESYVGEDSRLDVPRTGPMWNSIYTGLKPKEHGYTMDGWREGDSKFHQSYTVWDKLSEEDVSMALWDMPMTYRAKEINGFMLSGFVATTLKPMFDNMLYPSDIIEDNDFIENTPTWIAKAKYDGIAPKIENGERKPMDDVEDWYEDTREGEYNKLSKLKEISKKRGKKDIVAYGTTFADKIGHADTVNPTRELTREVYKDVDDILGELIEFFEPEHVIIISDHGFSGWSHDLLGYYYNSTGEELDQVFDFTPFILDYFDLEYEPSKYGLDEARGEDLSEKEKEDIKDQLADMGYNPN